MHQENEPRIEHSRLSIKEENTTLIEAVIQNDRRYKFHDKIGKFDIPKSVDETLGYQKMASCCVLKQLARTHLILHFLAMRHMHQKVAQTHW